MVDNLLCNVLLQFFFIKIICHGVWDETILCSTQLLFYVTILENCCCCRKTFKDALSNLRQFLATESPIKITKNAYQKDKFNFKIYDVTIWLTTMTIHILTSISRSKGNQAMKFNRQSFNRASHRKYFFENSCIKCYGDTVPRPFSKRSKLNISLNQYFKVFCSLFLLNPKLRTIRIY